ncbi:MAG: nitrous oxide-stimulated promoter family protein [Dehalococcoidales bacterium]|nr:nitrous oxide-stimulated promoter family protein [Dehalococcoidales bacterium]
MSELFERLDAKKAKDIKVLSRFIAIFCRENHPGQDRTAFPIKDDRLRQSLGNSPLELCRDCRQLLNHGIAKLLQCPYDPKPMCKKCPTHCYAAGYREKVREVMSFSGLYLIKHGRLDLIVHYYSK